MLKVGQKVRYYGEIRIIEEISECIHGCSYRNNGSLDCPGRIRLSKSYEIICHGIGNEFNFTIIGDVWDERKERMCSS